MAERTTQLRSLGQGDIQRIRFRMEDADRILQMSGRYFQPLGTFRLMNRPRYGLLAHDRVMWAEKLLGYDPEQSVLTTYMGQLIVRDRQNTVLKSIPPSELRLVGTEAEMGIVRESGYVLANHFYPLGEKGAMQAEEFDEILRSADAGQKPSDFDYNPRVKVDPALCGKKLWIGMFEFETDRSDVWDRDAVVVDPETRQLIAREVMRPLSRKHWVKTPPQPTFTNVPD